MLDEKPKRCIDPVMKYCQGCEYGYIIYPEDVETARDLEGCFLKKVAFLVLRILNLQNKNSKSLKNGVIEKYILDNFYNYTKLILFRYLDDIKMSIKKA